MPAHRRSDSTTSAPTRCCAFDGRARSRQHFHARSNHALQVQRLDATRSMLSGSRRPLYRFRCQTRPSTNVYFVPARDKPPGSPAPGPATKGLRERNAVAIPSQWCSAGRQSHPLTNSRQRQPERAKLVVIECSLQRKDLFPPIGRPVAPRRTALFPFANRVRLLQKQQIPFRGLHCGRFLKHQSIAQPSPPRRFPHWMALVGLGDGVPVP